MLFGLVHATVALLSLEGPTDIRVEPDWDQATIEAIGDAEIRFYPLKLVAGFVRFFLSPSGWKFAWSVLKTRRA